MTGILRQVLRGYRLAGYSELLAARQTCEVFEDLTGLWRKYILCISLHRECICLQIASYASGTSYKLQGCAFFTAYALAGTADGARVTNDSAPTTLGYEPSKNSRASNFR